MGCKSLATYFADDRRRNTAFPALGISALAKSKCSTVWNVALRNGITGYSCCAVLKVGKWNEARMKCTYRRHRAVGRIIMLILLVLQMPGLPIPLYRQFQNNLEGQLLHLHCPIFLSLIRLCIVL